MSRSDSLAAPAADPAVRHDHDRRRIPRALGVGPDAAGRVPEHPGVPAGDLVLARGQLTATASGSRYGTPYTASGAVGVLEDDRPGQRGGPGAQVHACLLQQPAAEPEPRAESWLPLISTMRAPASCSRSRASSHSSNGVHRRHRAVVDVPGDQDRVHLLGAGHVHQVIQECRLRRPQIRAVQRPAEVPVRGVQQSHGPDPSPGHRHYAGVRASQLSTSAFHLRLSASGAKHASNEFRASAASRASS